MSTDSALRWARAAVVVSVSLLVLKAIAAMLTGSHAVFSDAAESVVNVAAASVMLLAVRAASRPADLEHPFGHGKAELLAAAFEGALLLVAAAAIAWEAIPGLLSPTAPEHLGLGSVLVALTAAGNGVFGWLLIRTGRRTNSPALVADGRHLLTDSVSTIVVLVAIALVMVTDALWIDPAAACLVALWVAYTGLRMIGEAAHRLLDTRTPAYAEKITDALADQPLEGLLDPHDLRILDATSNVVVMLHARAPWMWTMSEAQAVRDRATRRIAALFDVPTEVQIQLEPCVPANCRACEVESCERRTDAFAGREALDPERISAPHP